MLQNQFFERLTWTIIVGIMFVYAMVKMAKHNNEERIPKRHLVLKVFGWIFMGISALMLVLAIIGLIHVQFPETMFEPAIGPNTIVRNSSSILYWGYPTQIQNSVLSSISGVFTFLGFAGYFLLFKSSHSKWWKKIFKFFAVLLMYIGMASATNFHYFDFPEFVAPILFVTVWYIIINRKEKMQNNRPTSIPLIIEDNEANSHSEDTQANFHDVEPSHELKSGKKPKVSFKPYFWTGLFIITLGIIGYLSVGHLGIYITETPSWGYEDINPSEYNKGIYPIDDKDSDLGYDSTIKYDDDRIAPFKGSGLNNHYALSREGQELWVLKLKKELIFPKDKLNFIRKCFAQRDYPSNLADEWNDVALGENAISYYYRDDFKTHHATVFIHGNNVGIALATGKDLEECIHLNEITLSKFTKFDYYAPHISFTEFQAINIILWLIVISILFLYTFKKVKSAGGFNSFSNKQAKIIVILNLCYLSLWFVISAVYTIDSPKVFNMLGIWLWLLPIWCLICAIVHYAIKNGMGSESEFYLIPQWLKDTLVKHNLNTQLVYRIILLFIVWPILYLCFIPFVGVFACMYTLCACTVLAIILSCVSAFKWIKQGKGIRVE